MTDSCSAARLVKRGESSSAVAASYEVKGHQDLGALTIHRNNDGSLSARFSMRKDSEFYNNLNAAHAKDQKKHSFTNEHPNSDAVNAEFCKTLEEEQARTQSLLREKGIAVANANRHFVVLEKIGDLPNALEALGFDDASKADVNGLLETHQKNRQRWQDYCEKHLDMSNPNVIRSRR